MLRRWLKSEGKPQNEYLVLVYRMCLLMFIYSICRVAFYLFNMSQFPNVSLSGFGLILLGGMKFDISALLYINSLYILLFLFPAPWKYSSGFKKGIKWLFVVTNGLGIALNSIDFIYYRFILKRTTGSVFSILKNEENMVSLWGQFFIDYWYVALFFVVVMILLVRWYSIFSTKPVCSPRRWVIYYPVSLLFLALFSGLTIVGMRGGYKHSTRPITLSNAGDFVTSPEEMAVVLNTPFALIRTFNKESFTRKNYFASEEALSSCFSPVKVVSKPAGFRKKNVVVIILESFSREFFASMNSDIQDVNYVGYTPFLDSLANNGLVFKNAFANGRKSIDALPSITASIPALVLPYVVSEYSSNKINSLASLLKTEGYETSFFHGAPNGSMGFQAFTRLAGFQKYYGMTEYGDENDYDGMWGIWDEPFFQFWGDELDKMQEPFLSTIFSVSSHHPFKVPEPYEGVFPEGNLPLHKCIGYTDNALRKFFNSVSQEVWFNNTLFVITADHSTSGFYKDYKTNANAFAVPLIFYSPDGSLRGIREDVAQQLDIMPTVLSYLGYEKPFVAFGNDLLSEVDDRFAINYVLDSYQLIRGGKVSHFNGKKFTGYYDLEEDPFMKDNLFPQVEIDGDDKAFFKAVVQQFNNRMLDDHLTLKKEDLVAIEKPLGGEAGGALMME